MCELLKCAYGRSGASGECSNTPINSQCEADAVANKLHIWITAAAAFFCAEPATSFAEYHRC